MGHSYLDEDLVRLRLREWEGLFLQDLQATGLRDSDCLNCTRERHLLRGREVARDLVYTGTRGERQGWACCLKS